MTAQEIRGRIAKALEHLDTSNMSFVKDTSASVMNEYVPKLRSWAEHVDVIDEHTEFVDGCVTSADETLQFMRNDVHEMQKALKRQAEILDSVNALFSDLNTAKDAEYKRNLG